MDNVTHTLFALTVARTPLGRARGTTAALVLSSSAPDIDFVSSFGGSASYLQWHRGPTHGPLGVVGLSLLTAAIVWSGSRLIDRRRPARMSAGGGFAPLLTASVVGACAHILMDLPTSYGTRLLSPFAWQWFAFDLMPIIDVYLLALLAGGLMIGRGSASARQRTAAVVLVAMAVNYGVRAAAHHEALNRTARLFGPALPRDCATASAPGWLPESWPDRSEAGAGSRCLLETAAIPTFLSPFRWRVVAQITDGYEIYDLNLLDRRLRSRTPPPELLSTITTRVPNRWSSVAEQAARMREAQALLGFSRFPQVHVVDGAAGAATVRFTDMRFNAGPQDGTPLQSRRSSLFTVTVQVGSGSKALQER
jgi:membrane-bound metal-dependent hydrolase YbcI (DUF457 family)